MKNKPFYVLILIFLGLLFSLSGFTNSKTSSPQAVITKPAVPNALVSATFGTDADDQIKMRAWLKENTRLQYVIVGYTGTNFNVVITMAKY